MKPLVFAVALALLCFVSCQNSNPSSGEPALQVSQIYGSWYVHASDKISRTTGVFFDSAAYDSPAVLYVFTTDSIRELVFDSANACYGSTGMAVEYHASISDSFSNDSTINVFIERWGGGIQLNWFDYFSDTVKKEYLYPVRDSLSLKICGYGDSCNCRYRIPIGQYFAINDSRAMTLDILDILKVYYKGHEPAQSQPRQAP